LGFKILKDSNINTHEDVEYVRTNTTNGTRIESQKLW
jgi:hypothetical protein